MQFTVNAIVEHQDLTATGALPDINGDSGNAGSVDVSGDFTGLPRTYSLTSAPVGVTIDQSGIVSWPAGAASGSIVVQVANDATPAGVSSGFTLSIQEAGQPLALYRSDFTVDASTDFDAAPASLAYDAVNDAMVFGTEGETWPTLQKTFALESNHQYQMLFRSALIGAGSTTSDTFLTIRAVDQSEDFQVIGDLNNVDGVYNFTAPDTAKPIELLFDAKLRGAVVGTVQYRLDTLELWRTTNTNGGFPSSTNKAPLFWAAPLSVGLPGQPIDFAGAFAGNVSEFTYDGPEPHSWNGSELTITPAAETGGRVSRSVRAKNGEIVSFDAYNIDILAANAVALAEREALPDFAVEVDRPFSMSMLRHIIGGNGDLAFTIEGASLPSWLTMESNGHIHGRAPVTAQAQTDITIRATDSGGIFIDVVISMEVIATIDRSSPVDIPLGSELLDEANNNAPFDPPQYAERDIISWLKANAGSDRVFRLLDGVAYTWGNSYAAFNQPQNDPVIVMGETQNVTLNGVKFNQCSGLILEGFTLRRTGVTATDKDTRSKLNLIANTEPNSRDVRFYDMVVHADPVSIDPSATSGDGIPWNNNENFITIGVGITVGPWGIVDRCQIHDVYAGINISAGHHAGVFDAHVVDFGIDGITIDRTEGAVVSGCTFRNPIGNYTDATHRDLIQTFANNEPMPEGFVFIDSFASVSGVDGIQGHLLDLDGYAATDRTPKTGSNYRHIHRGNAVFASTNSHGWQYERFQDGIFDHMVVVNHPDVDRVASIDMRRSSQVAFSNSLVKKFTGGSPDTTFNAWKHLCTFTNVNDLSQTGDDLSAIFPNWNNIGLTYECPREAVANGLNADQARFWIDPNSAWGQANSNIGPSWLRTG